MRIYFSVKQIKKRGDQVASCPWELPHKPETLRQLLGMLVSQGIEIYNRRIHSADEMRPASKEAMEDMERIGKIGFGIPFSAREADAETALDAAIAGFEDGLYRLFIGEREIESLDGPLNLQEDDTVTIIRLVMLTGGYF